MFYRYDDTKLIRNTISHYVMSKRRFIIPVNVYLNHIFYNVPENDFCLNATILKR